MNEHVFAVLMAGGAGTRFWPLSRRSRPKQVLAIADDRPMIRGTVDRLGDLAAPERILVVTGEDQADALQAALPDLPAENFLLEPAPRNTAPCIGLAAAHALARDAEALLLCLPADHVIRPAEEFRATCRTALARADEARTLLTFGVKPTWPATGYGYIQLGEEVAPGVRSVARFVEKPDRSTAEEYLAEGNYRWNSGMFAWRADVFLEEAASRLPELAPGLRELREDPGRAAEVFPRLPAISVDYGVMERTDRAEVVEADFTWDDVGSFEALSRLVSRDDSGNHSRADLVALDAAGNVVIGPDDHLVALLGVEDLIVVNTGDVTLVCPRSRAEEIKLLLAEVALRGRPDLC